MKKKLEKGLIILPSYLGIISYTIIRIPMNQPVFQWKLGALFVHGSDGLAAGPPPVGLPGVPGVRPTSTLYMLGSTSEVSVGRSAAGLSSVLGGGKN